MVAVVIIPSYKKIQDLVTKKEIKEWFNNETKGAAESPLVKFIIISIEEEVFASYEFIMPCSFVLHHPGWEKMDRLFEIRRHYKEFPSLVILV